MTAVVRYAGRLGGPGVDDQLSGPATLDALTDADVIVIADPMSFPWHLLDPAAGVPVVVDLRGRSTDDLVALEVVLPVLTPGDRLIVDDPASSLAGRLHFPTAMLLTEEPDDVALARLADDATRRAAALLRDGLEPILAGEITDLTAAGRSPRIAEVAAPDDWTSSFVDPVGLAPHDAAATLPPSSADVVILRCGPLLDDSVRHALAALEPGGLLVIVLDQAAVTTAGGTTMRGLLDLLRASLGARFVFEHIWGLHTRPGRPPIGGIVAIRPLGGAIETRA